MSRAVWGSLVFVLSVCILLSGSAVFAAQYQSEHEARKICKIMLILDDAYQTPPGPQTPAGKNLAKAVHDYVADLGCRRK